MLVKAPNEDTETAINALIRHAHKLPLELCKSLTWDRGKEMADHKRFTMATDIKVYFCYPQNPSPGPNRRATDSMAEEGTKNVEVKQ